MSQVWSAVRKHQQVCLVGPVREMRQVRSLLRRPLGKRLEEIGGRKSWSGTRDSQGRYCWSQPKASPFPEEDLRISGQVHNRPGILREQLYFMKKYEKLLFHKGQIRIAKKTLSVAVYNHYKRIYHNIPINKRSETGGGLLNDQQQSQVNCKKDKNLNQIKR